MKKIIVLGSTGMLGSAVGSYLLSKPKDYTVALSYRNKSVAYGQNAFKFDPLKDKLKTIPHGDVIINCIGIIKPYIDKSRHDAVFLNSLFPWKLADYAETIGAKLIHITTDCVFSGTKGNYDEKAEHDALDFYGKSKSLGEPNNCTVLRTSIIGEELHNNASLIAWAQSMRGKETNGFTNHLWNGITTKQYAKVCDTIISKNLFSNDLYHIFSNPVTKFELMTLINKRFNLGLTIKPFTATTAIDRTLSTTKDLNKKLAIPSIAEMVAKI
jgi:dTDP-4-dehydrorhamnose reductase